MDGTGKKKGCVKEYIDKKNTFIENRENAAEFPWAYTVEEGLGKLTLDILRASKTREDSEPLT